MSGHSKWNNIKARKGKQDAIRGKIFTKIGRELQVAVKQGGPDPDSNSRLKDVISKAKANNMPNDNITNAIKKASGVGNESNFEEIVYEGYGPHGVAVIVNALTDNRNRTASEVRHLFDKSGGNLGTTGCVAYMFEKKGQIVIEKETVNMLEDDLMMLAIEAGAEDFKVEDEIYEIITNPADFSNILEKLEKNNIKFLEANIAMIPNNYVSLDEHQTEKVLKLIDNLENLDDVQDVFHNCEG